jgi:LysM repeat protein
MTTNNVHIFEFLQQIQDTPHDLSLQGRLDNHLAQCSECRQNMALFNLLKNEADWKPAMYDVHRLSNLQMTSNIQQQIQHRRRFPKIFRPLPDFAWIILLILIVVIMSWGISRLRPGQYIQPAASIQLSTPTSTPTQVSSDRPTCRSILYTVEEKNTLLAISAYFNMAVDVIWRENDLGNDAVLEPGMSLIIPFCGWTPVMDTPDVDDVTPIDNCPPVIYNVQQGDTIQNISAFFGVSLSTIVSDNQLDTSTVLLPGTDLVIRLCKVP